MRSRVYDRTSVETEDGPQKPVAAITLSPHESEEFKQALDQQSSLPAVDKLL